MFLVFGKLKIWFEGELFFICKGDLFCICGDNYCWVNFYIELVVVVWIILLFVY